MEKINRWIAKHPGGCKAIIWVALVILGVWMQLELEAPIWLVVIVLAAGILVFFAAIAAVGRLMQLSVRQKIHSQSAC